MDAAPHPPTGSQATVRSPRVAGQASPRSPPVAPRSRPRRHRDCPSRHDAHCCHRIGRELVWAALPQVLVAVAAGFGRAISEVGASHMVGGNILGQTRILTTTIARESGRGDFALALSLGFVLLALALGVNALLGLAARRAWPAA